MKPLVTMRRALADDDLFGKVLAGESWAAWRVMLIALMGEALTDDERAVFQSLTDREREPLSRVDEAFCVMAAGRENPLHGRPGGLYRGPLRPP